MITRLENAHGEEDFRTLLGFIDQAIWILHGVAGLSRQQIDWFHRSIVETSLQNPRGVVQLLSSLGDAEHQESTEALRVSPEAVYGEIANYRGHLDDNESFAMVKTVLELSKIDAEIKEAETTATQEVLLERLSWLMSPETIRLCQRMVTIREQVDPDEFKAFLLAIDNPVLSVWKRILDNPALGIKEGKQLSAHLIDFRDLDRRAQEAVLNEIAIQGLYAPPEGLEQIPFLAGRLYSRQPITAGMVFLLAGFLMIGFLAWLGVLLARGIKFRERLLSLVYIDRPNPADDHRSHVNEPETPLDLEGREDLTAFLREISQRGYGTVAVVGRRGVGKTRVLKEMLDQARQAENGYGGDPDHGTAAAVDDEAARSAVGVWMNVPTTYSEKDFVRALHEQLAERVEATMARRLKVLPLAARLHLGTLRNWELALAAFLFMLFFLTWLNFSNLISDRILSAYLLPLVSLVVPIVLIAVSLGQIPPVNLYRWLLRDSDHRSTDSGMQAALLYQEATTFTKAFRRKSERRFSRLAAAALVLLIFTALALLDSELFFLGSALILVLAIFGFLAVKAISYFLPRDEPKDIAATDSTSSLPAVVADYRKFAKTVVKRLSEANGKGAPQRVIICLDELDKIIDPTGTREFLRRMKGLFEIEGVYYFISLAEDARRSLMVGSALGKDEVDSSVDHVKIVQPLKPGGCKRLIRQYIESVDEAAASHRSDEPVVDLTLHEPLETFMTIASAGLPRDLLRLIDLWIAGKKCADKAKNVYDELAFMQELIASEMEGFFNAGLLLRPSVFRGEEPAGQGRITLADLRSMMDETSGSMANHADSDALVEGTFRSLLRLYVLTAVAESWQVGGDGFPWDEEESTAFLGSLLQLAYAIPVERPGLLHAARLRIDQDLEVFHARAVKAAPPSPLPFQASTASG